METDASAVGRTLLLGTQWNRRRFSTRALLAVALLGITAGAYVLDLFQTSSGVIWVPEHAAGLGLIVAGWAGYRRDGVVVGWVLAYAPLLGYLAAESFFYDSDTVRAGLADFLRPDGLAYIAVLAIVIGLPAFVVGYGLQYGWRRLRRQ